MLERLMKLSGELGLEFGVKITNTFPVDVKAGELPSEEMYMSGKSLYPLSIALAAKLAREFSGKLRIAYSGGADAFNIQRIVGAGVWPVTVATSRQNSSMPPRLHRLYNRLGRWSVFTWIPSYKVISRQTFEKALAPDRARKGAEERRVGPRGGVLGGRPVRKGGL